MKAPEVIPDAVKAGLQRYADQHAMTLGYLLRVLKFDTLMGCYYFEHAGMYHGVELDGYVHT